MKPVNLKLTSIIEAKLTERLSKLVKHAKKRGTSDVPLSMLTVSNLIRIATQRGLDALADLDDAALCALIANEGLRRGGRS